MGPDSGNDHQHSTTGDRNLQGKQNGQKTLENPGDLRRGGNGWDGNTHNYLGHLWFRREIIRNPYVTVLKHGHVSFDILMEK